MCGGIRASNYYSPVIFIEHEVDQGSALRASPPIKNINPPAMPLVSQPQKLTSSNQAFSSKYVAFLKRLTCVAKDYAKLCIHGCSPSAVLKRSTSSHLTHTCSSPFVQGRLLFSTFDPSLHTILQKQRSNTSTRGKGTSQITHSTRHGYRSSSNTSGTSCRSPHLSHNSPRPSLALRSTLR